MIRSVAVPGAGFVSHTRRPCHGNTLVFPICRQVIWMLPSCGQNRAAMEEQEQGLFGIGQLYRRQASGPVSAVAISKSMTVAAQKAQEVHQHRSAMPMRRSAEMTGHAPGCRFAGVDGIRQQGQAGQPDRLQPGDRMGAVLVDAGRAPGAVKGAKRMRRTSS